jgi:multidrug efflux system membrane fusion protein
VNQLTNPPQGAPLNLQPSRRGRAKLWTGAAILILAAGGAWLAYDDQRTQAAERPTPPPPQVVVSRPLERNLDARLGFLGQFSAVGQVELRAQVGGTLTDIHFKDGDIVHKGDLLFAIDPVPYDIRLAQANAALASATARLDLASREFVRAQDLKRSDAGTTENVDQRQSERRAAQAAIDAAKAQIRDPNSTWTIARSPPPSPGVSAAISSPSAT